MTATLIPPPTSQQRQYTPLVASVEPKSIAERLGISKGDLLVSVNGHTLRDIVDYRFYTADEHLDIEVARADETHLLQIEKDSDEAFGVEFESILFDDILRCNNNCYFCFIAGNPKEMRRTLFIKDDDYRLSFLFGDFITLTNLTPEDWERIEEQHLSPLYVSVHATELEVRQKLLANKRSEDVLQGLDRLAGLGVQVHTQIVLCPDINDGVHLDRSITDLAQRYPQVQSISVVPVGLTELNQVRGARKLKSPEPLDQVCSPAYARDILTLIQAYQKDFQRRFKTPVVLASDEFYLQGDVDVPPARHYGDYPQFENGIGMVRWLLQDWARAKTQLAKTPAKAARLNGLRLSLVSGAMIAPTLQPLVDEFGSLTGSQPQLIIAPNRNYGAHIGCSGLLTAGDILAALESAPVGDVVVLPRRSLDATGKMFLDNLTPEVMQQRVGRPVLYVETLSELLTSLQTIDLTASGATAAAGA